MTGPRTAVPVRARAATTALFLANGCAIGAWAACIAPLKARLSLTDADLGMMLLVAAAAAIVAMPIGGWLGTRFDSHRTALAGAALLAIGLTLPGLAPDLPWLLAAAAPLGVGNGLLDVAMNGHATAVQRAWGGPIMSSFHAAFSLGGLAGAVAAGWLLAHPLPVEATLTAAALAVAGLAAGAGLIGLTRGMPPPRRAAAASALVWPDRALLGIGLLTFLTMLSEGVIADWSGVFLVSVAGAGVATAAGGYAAFAVAMVVGRLLGDRIVTVLGPTRVMRAGGVMVASGMALGLAAATPVAATVGFAIVGLGLANMIPVLFSAAGRGAASPPGIASAPGGGGPGMGIAMAATIGYGGFLLGPPAIGLAADWFGLRLALAGLLAGGLATALAARPILEPRRAQTAPSRLAT